MKHVVLAPDKGQNSPSSIFNKQNENRRGFFSVRKKGTWQPMLSICLCRNLCGDGTTKESKRGSVFYEENEWVATNAYLRETFEKPKERSANFEKKGFRSYLCIGKVLAPHAPVTKNDIL